MSTDWMEGKSPEERSKTVMEELIEIIPLKPEKIRWEALLEKSSKSRYAVFKNLKNMMHLTIVEKVPVSHKEVYYWRLMTEREAFLKLSLNGLNRELKELQSHEILNKIRKKLKDVQIEPITIRDQDSLTIIEADKEMGDRLQDIIKECYQ